jgi:hypothetical protein
MNNNYYLSLENKKITSNNIEIKKKKTIKREENIQKEINDDMNKCFNELYEKLFYGVHSEINYIIDELITKGNTYEKYCLKDVNDLLSSGYSCKHQCYLKNNLVLKRLITDGKLKGLTLFYLHRYGVIDTTYVKFDIKKCYIF